MTNIKLRTVLCLVHAQQTHTFNEQERLEIDVLKMNALWLEIHYFKIICTKVIAYKS